jgi:hypothetical protein
MQGNNSRLVRRTFPYSLPFMNRRFLSTRLAISLALTSFFVTVAGCATSTRVLSHGPTYYGDRPVTKLYVYFFIDMRPEYMPEAFQRVASAKLSEALQNSGIPNEQLWFSETAEGRILQSDIKRHTLTDTTFVSVGATVRENSERDRALTPSHRLIVFPRETLKSGNGAVFNVKWDVIDTHSGHLEWSVYTQTSALSRAMDPAQAEAAAKGFVDAIVQEMRDRNVIPRSKT